MAGEISFIHTPEPDSFFHQIERHCIETFLSQCVRFLRALSKLCIWHSPISVQKTVVRWFYLLCMGQFPSLGRNVNIFKRLFFLLLYGDRIIISLAGLQHEYFLRHKESRRWTLKNINDRLTAESSRTSRMRDKRMVYARYYSIYSFIFSSQYFVFLEYESSFKKHCGGLMFESKHTD